MNKQSQPKTNGFTIIEVVLVLAIAGLILMMVFIALPALQSGQRDSDRKKDVASVLAEVETYASLNRGKLPTTPTEFTTIEDGATGFASQLVDKLSSNTTDVAVHDFENTASVSDGQVLVVTGAVCDELGSTSDGTATYKLKEGSKRQYAVVTKLEASNGAAFCQGS